MRTPALLLAALAVAASGCGDDAGGEAGGEVRAVATTTITGDLVLSVGGGRVDLDTLVPPNADPHDFEPRPSDAVALADADVVLESGGDLDEWLSELTDSAGGDAAEVTLLDSVR
ncbi:MAG: metal ABC transporter substrate-binding protein, partial [Pseudonocardiaceae bacterium]